MRRAADRLVATILAAIMLATACGGADAPTSSRPARAPAPDPATTPSPDPPAPTADATGETVAQVIGTAQAATGMVVSIVLLDPHEEIEVPLPAETPVMDQIGRQFVPGFILVRAGQTINFTNSEDELHTVHVKDSNDESLFNVATMMGFTYEHIFEEGDDYSVVCNTHTEMFADILVVDTPYAVVADREGNFTVSDVVPGSYTAVVIHGNERTEYEVDIVSGQNDLNLAD
ncbi:MAG: hypothetical protein VYE68_13820 [Acidobacteriota bacterium]|nr:hypothetical protein [Acidobacteriota bacterium]